MTAFQSYRKYVLEKSIIVSVAFAVTISIIFGALLPVIEKSLPNSETDTVAVQEVGDE